MCYFATVYVKLRSKRLRIKVKYILQENKLH